MPFDSFFSSSVKLERFQSSGGRRRGISIVEEIHRAEVIDFVCKLAPWTVSFDGTFGQGEWKGRRNGSRRDRRDLVCATKKRGFDADDALWLFKSFMERVAPHVTWVCGAEENRDWGGVNPGWHIHAMLAHCDDLLLKRLQRLWVEENGWAKVNFIRSKVGRTNYCTKHMVRRAGSLLDWQINNRGLWEGLTNL